MKAELRDISLNIAQKFVQLDQESKIFIAGYMTGKLEERAKWEEKSKVSKNKGIL